MIQQPGSSATLRRVRHRTHRHLDDALRRFGAPHGLPERLHEAALANPRHRFVRRFRFGKDGPAQDFDDDPIGLLPLIYQGQPLTHVDADGAQTGSAAIVRVGVIGYGTPTVAKRLFYAYRRWCELGTPGPVAGERVDRADCAPF